MLGLVMAVLAFPAFLTTFGNTILQLMHGPKKLISAGLHEYGQLVLVLDIKGTLEQDLTFIVYIMTFGNMIRPQIPGYKKLISEGLQEDQRLDLESLIKVILEQAKITLMTEMIFGNIQIGRASCRERG